MSYYIRVIVEPSRVLFVCDFVKYVSFCSDVNYALRIHDRDLALDIVDFLTRKYPGYDYQIAEG